MTSYTNESDVLCFIYQHVGFVVHHWWKGTKGTLPTGWVHSTCQLWYSMFFLVFWQGKVCRIPICSMYGIFRYVYHKHQPSVGREMFLTWSIWDCWREVRYSRIVDLRQVLTKKLHWMISSEHIVSVHLKNTLTRVAIKIVSWQPEGKHKIFYWPHPKQWKSLQAVDSMTGFFVRDIGYLR